jgi:cell division protein ZapA
MIHLDVTIMGQPYRLVCKEGEERALREAAAFLDKKMSAIRDAGKVKGNDRIAVMAALGMAAEFLSVKSPQGPLSDLTILEVQQKISAMHQVLDGALTPQEALF